KIAPPRPMPIAAHQRNLAHSDGKIPIDAATLRHIGDASLGVIGWLAKQLYSAKVGTHKAQNRFDERRLAGTIRTDDADQLPGGNLHRNIEQSRGGTVADRQMLD